MFSRKKDVAEADQAAQEAVVDFNPAQAKKGRPTPKRKEAEAANKRPLVPADRSQATKTDKEARRKQRELANIAMQTGDERHMPAQHAGKERRFIRDFIDARRSIGEFLLPVLLLLLVASLAIGSNPKFVNLMVVLMLVMYALLFIALIDGVLAIRKMKKQMIAKWGRAGYPRGSAAYAFSRLIQIRRMRLPKPMVGRGEYPH